MYIANSEELRMLKNHTRHIYCRLELLDYDLNVIDNLEGLAIDGSLTIDADSDIRRTFSCTIHLKQKEKISQYSIDEWINKLIKVYIGMRPAGGNTHWYSQGVFAFSQNGFTYSESEHNVSVSAVDLVAMLDGTLSGTLTGYKTVIEIGTDIGSAIADTFKLSGYTDCIIDYWKRTVPYDLEFSTDTTIWEILTQLRDLYYPFEMFFRDTTFVCQEIPSGFDDPLVLDNDVFQDLVISEDCSIDYSEVKNCVELFGASVEYDQFVDIDQMSIVTDGDVTTLTLNTTDLDTTQDCMISFVTPVAGLQRTVMITVQNKTTEITDGSTNVFTHGPYKLLEADVDENGIDVDMDGTTIGGDTMIVIKYSPDHKTFYYRGEQQPHAMVMLVDKEPTKDEIEQAKIDEACNNIKFVCLTDTESRATDVTKANPRFTIGKIGRRNKVCSGDEYDVYTTDASAMQCAEYEHWKSCRLTDSVSVQCLLVPWLDVNQKLAYVPRYVDDIDEPLEFLIKQINISLGEGTMDLTLSRYYPYYPYIVQNKH